MKYIIDGPINNNPAMFYAMGWRQAIISTNDSPVKWRIYARLGLNEFTAAYRISLHEINRLSYYRLSNGMIWPQASR